MVIIIFLHIHFKKSKTILDFLEEFCTENTTILPIYWHVLIAALVWFPLTIQLICYAAIFWQLDRYEQRVRRREHPISLSYKTKCARTIFIVVIAFVVLRLPFTALIFVRNQMLKNNEMDQVEGSFQALWYTAHYLIFLNAALTPVIYGYTNDNFRLSFFIFYLKNLLNFNFQASFSRTWLVSLDGEFQV